MLLTKGGITVDVIHPADIARYKHLGYAEVPETKPEEPKAEKAKVERARGKPEGSKSEEPKEGKE